MASREMCRLVYDAYAKGESVESLAIRLGVTKSYIYRILRNKNDVLEIVDMTPNERSVYKLLRSGFSVGDVSNELDMPISQVQKIIESLRVKRSSLHSCGRTIKHVRVR